MLLYDIVKDKRQQQQQKFCGTKMKCVNYCYIYILLFYIFMTAHASATVLHESKIVFLGT